MNFLKSLINGFLNLFRSNEVILQLTIQSIAGEVMKKRPGLKPIVSQAIGATITVLGSNPTVMTDFPALIKSKINVSSLLPPEQSLVFIMADAVGTEMKNYFSKVNITAPLAQAQMAIKVLGWIDEMAKL